MASAARAVIGINCSAHTLALVKRRQGQPTLSGTRQSRPSRQASPARRPVSMTTITKWRVVASGRRARAASDSSWDIWSSGTKRGRPAGRRGRSSW
ncbi:MAG: hypothetical protein ACR2MO_01035 [Acidimicrobiales bacterium]